MSESDKYEELQRRVDFLEKELSEVKQELSSFVKPTETAPQQPSTKKQVRFFPGGPSPQKAPIPKKSLLERFGVKDDLEMFLGGNLLGKSGLVAIILATLWFIKYAFDNYWINESGRIYIGLLIGFATIGVSLYLSKKKYNIIPQATLGSGYAILYISISSAYHFYNLIGLTECFLYLFALSIFTGLLAGKSKQQILYTFSFLGSLIAPMVVSHGENSYKFLFTYLTLTNALFLYISKDTTWRVAPFLVFLGNAFLFAGWSNSHLAESSFPFPFVYLCATYGMLLVREVKFMPENRGNVVTSSIVLLLFYTFSFGASGVYVVGEFYPQLTPHFFLLLSLFLTLACQYNQNKQAPGLQTLQPILFVLWVIAFFVSLTDFTEGRWTSLAWLAFAGSISILGAQKRIVWFLFLSSVLWAFALIRLFLHETRFDYDYYFLFNPRFGLFVLAASLLFATYWVQRRKSLAGGMQGFVFVGLFVLIFGTMVENYYRSNADYRSLGYSYVLVFYMLVTLIPGFVKNFRSLRISGIVLSVLLVVKLYLYDIWDMSLVVRIIAGFSLGIGLVLLSIVYQKYKNKIQEKKP
ncbi:MAG: DUF2339 domain-containing protein [Spirochaetota bacterium]